MIEVYTIPSNLPSRQSVSWLTENDVPFIEIKVRSNKNTLSVDQLKQFLAASENGLDDLIAFQSTAYRKFQATHDTDSMSLQQMLTAMANDPHLIHYPLLFDRDAKLLQSGFSQDEIRVFLPRAVRTQELQQLLQRELLETAK